jgi:hypothetical protein
MREEVRGASPVCRVVRFNGAYHRNEHDSISALSLCLKQSMAETELQWNAARDLRKYQIIAGRYAEAFNHSVL